MHPAPTPNSNSLDIHRAALAAAELRYDHVTPERSAETIALAYARELNALLEHSDTPYAVSDAVLRVSELAGGLSQGGMDLDLRSMLHDAAEAEYAYGIRYTGGRARAAAEWLKDARMIMDVWAQTVAA